jgi:hypothetical protein
MRVLGPHSELMATFSNEDHEPEPRLRSCCMRERVPAGAEDQGVVAADGSAADHSVRDTDQDGEVRMRRLWCLREVEQDCRPDCDGVWDQPPSQCYRGAGTGEGYGESKVTRRPRSITPASTGGSGTDSGATHPAGDGDSSVASSSPGERGMEAVVRAGSKRSAQAALSAGSHDSCSPAQVQYVLEDQDGNVSLVDSWKDLFAPIWEMKCPRPAPASSPR